MQTDIAARERPPITLIDSEAETLWSLALAGLEKSSMAAKLLLEELERAETHPSDAIPPHIVTMMSKVVFVDERTGERYEVQLVYPRDADNEQHRVSVMTPIGAALIGMAQGASIEWPNRAGDLRPLKILEVVQPQAVS
jgi:regulator of nucleoside diphosphate kinase